MKAHMLTRYCDLELHRPVLDEVERIATFYLWNLSGELVGYQQYRPEGEKKPQNHPTQGKYFTYRKRPTLAVFGVETLYRPGPLFITEGIFDACRLTNRGCAAIAVLANNPGTDLANWLYMLGRKVVAVCDNDAAGRKLAKYGHVAEFTEDKDLGDSSEEYVTQLINKYERS